MLTKSLWDRNIEREEKIQKKKENKDRGQIWLERETHYAGLLFLHEASGFGSCAVSCVQYAVPPLTRSLYLSLSLCEAFEFHGGISPLRLPKINSFDHLGRRNLKEYKAFICLSPPWMADLVACSTPFLLGCGAVSLLEQISAGLEERKVKERRREGKRKLKTNQIKWKVRK